ncbi:hypothetical protein K502DRAFT_297122, partial [Neoconidiobolus thromboides FSU 785]
KDGPKRPMNAYLLFNKENRPKLLKANPNASTPEVSRAIGDKWKSLSLEEKQVYIDQALELRTQFFSDNPGYVFTRQSKSSIKASLLNPTGMSQRGRRKRDRNSDAPKHPMSAFLFYLVEKRSEVAEKHSGNPIGPISRIISQRWNKLSDEEKKPWVMKAEEDKRRYATELKAFQIATSKPRTP